MTVEPNNHNKQKHTWVWRNPVRVCVRIALAWDEDWIEERKKVLDQYGHERFRVLCPNDCEVLSCTQTKKLVIKSKKTGKKGRNHEKLAHLTNLVSRLCVLHGSVHFPFVKTAR